MLVAGPVAQKAGIRNLYLASAALLVVIGAMGYGRLQRQTAPVEQVADLP
jgi:hypothetical protein